uniref:AlNc14C364G11036 protein n=1 Tax=Albugo laibachii Nc14 TaxID=890382 RepID=F0WXU9_9STRA|nr:AlNc14C364G11036 [Albugo laibachii Nc14]|eukprot:CCA26297.1 AlNc14C364G11036 [Albugo laibachii Nc14]
MTPWYSSTAFLVSCLNALSAQEHSSLVSCPGSWFPVSVLGEQQIYCIPNLPCGGMVGVASSGSCPGGTACASLPQNPAVMGCVALGRPDIQYLDRTILFSPPVPFTMATLIQGPPPNTGPPIITNGVPGVRGSIGTIVPTPGPSFGGGPPNGSSLGASSLPPEAGPNFGNVATNPGVSTSSTPGNSFSNSANTLNNPAGSLNDPANSLSSPPGLLNSGARPPNPAGNSAFGTPGNPAIGTAGNSAFGLAGNAVPGAARNSAAGNVANPSTNNVNQPAGRIGSPLGNTNSLIGSNGGPTRNILNNGVATFPTPDANNNGMPSSNSDNGISDNNNGATGDKVTDEQRRNPSDVVGPATQNSTNSKLSLGAIIAIILGCLAVIAVIAGVILLKKNKQIAAAQREQEASIGSSYLTPRERVLLL